MGWIYVMIAVAGLVPLVPTVLQAIDGSPPHAAYSGFAFGATAWGLAGAFLSQFSTGGVTNLVASLAVGLAAGAIHPEVVAALVRRGEGISSRGRDGTV